MGFLSFMRTTTVETGRVLLVSFRTMFAPWWLTSKSVENLLTCGSPDELTKSWVDMKLAEHSFVGVTVSLFSRKKREKGGGGKVLDARLADVVLGSTTQCALLAGVVTAALSWQDPTSVHWITRGLWYGSILIDMASICLATQQSVALNRLCCYQDRWEKIRRMLGAGPDHTRPHKIQLFVWQAPIMLLNFGVILFVVGLTASFFSDMKTPRTREDEMVRPRGDVHQRAWRLLTLKHRPSNCSPLLGHSLVRHISSASSL